MQHRFGILWKKVAKFDLAARTVILNHFFEVNHPLFSEKMRVQTEKKDTFQKKKTQLNDELCLRL